MRILVVDDHAIVRAAIGMLVRRAHPDWTVLEAGCMAAARGLAAREIPDMVVLDLSLPDAHGIEAPEKMLEVLPRGRILVFTTHAEERYGIRCLRAGALGYLTKDSGEDILLGAIEEVAEGRRWASQTILHSLLAGEGAIPLHHKLTPREFEILGYMGSGRPVGEIAIILGLSVKTVSTHRERILAKLGLTNNMEVIRYCLQEGLVA